MKDHHNARRKNTRRMSLNEPMVFKISDVVAFLFKGCLPLPFESQKRVKEQGNKKEPPWHSVSELAQVLAVRQVLASDRTGPITF